MYNATEPTTLQLRIFREPLTMGKNTGKRAQDHKTMLGFLLHLLRNDLNSRMQRVEVLNTLHGKVSVKSALTNQY